MNTKHDWRLLASGPSAESLKKSIAKFWVTTPQDIQIDGESVILRGKPIPIARVIRKGRRWRFEGRAS